jgi:hypothetical protein
MIAQFDFAPVHGLKYIYFMEEMLPKISSYHTVSCEHCLAENTADKKFCTQCRYPIAGTDDEKREFRANIAKNKSLLKSAGEHIHSAKNIIYWLAGLSMLTGLILFFSQDDLASLVAYGLICILYLGLAAWCSSNPFGSILTAFIVYISLQLLYAIINPVSLASGFIWKIIFIGSFIKGIRSASEARNYMRELEKSKVKAPEIY